MNVFVVGRATNYANFIEGAQLVDNPEKADIVLFTGGEDVDPSLYGCEKHSCTYSNIKREANFPIKYLDKAASALPNWRCKKKPFLPIKLWVIRCYKKLNYLIISNKKFPPPES